MTRKACNLSKYDSTSTVLIFPGRLATSLILTESVMKIGYVLVSRFLLQLSAFTSNI